MSSARAKEVLRQGGWVCLQGHGSGVQRNGTGAQKGCAATKVRLSKHARDVTDEVQPHRHVNPVRLPSHQAHRIDVCLRVRSPRSIKGPGRLLLETNDLSEQHVEEAATSLQLGDNAFSIGRGSLRPMAGCLKMRA